MIYELGEVIATRELYIENDGTKSIIRVLLGKPTPFQDSSDYYVPFQIRGLGSETVLCAAGIDAFQALQQVMSVIDAQLLALNEACEGRLRWDGNETGNLGFPE